MTLRGDITNMRFGKLVVVGRTQEQDSIGCYLWLCKCDCGGEIKVRRSTLAARGSKAACGCRKGFQKTHGQRDTPGFNAWSRMKNRCLNPNSKDYRYYGGRGIMVCDRWLNSFENFIADMGQPPPGMTLERIKNDLGYEPDNCKWATVREQASNRRSNRRLEYNGQTKTLTQWSEQLQISRAALTCRLRRGWSIERSLTTPVRK